MMKPIGFGMALQRAERHKLDALDERDQRASRTLHDDLQKELDKAEGLGRRSPKDAYLALADVAHSLEESRKEQFPHVKSKITVFAEDKPSAAIVNDALEPVITRIRQLARRWSDALSVGKARFVLRSLDSDREYVIPQEVTQPLFDRIGSAMPQAERNAVIRRAIDKNYS